MLIIRTYHSRATSNSCFSSTIKAEKRKIVFYFDRMYIEQMVYLLISGDGVTGGALQSRMGVNATRKNHPSSCIDDPHPSRHCNIACRSNKSKKSEIILATEFM